MMRVHPIAVLAACMLLGACAVDPAGSESAPPAPVQSAGVDDQSAVGEPDVICREEPITGSRFTHRICTTREQRLADQERVREAQQRGTLGRPPGT